jgi:hypothetical protein
MVIWYIYWQSGVSFGHLVYLMVIWYILWSFGILFPTNSGNPGGHSIRSTKIEKDKIICNFLGLNKNRKKTLAGEA